MKLHDKLKEYLEGVALICVALIILAVVEYESFIEKRNKRGGY